MKFTGGRVLDCCRAVAPADVNAGFRFRLSPAGAIPVVGAHEPVPEPALLLFALERCLLQSLHGVLQRFEHLHRSLTRPLDAFKPRRDRSEFGTVIETPLVHRSCEGLLVGVEFDERVVQLYQVFPMRSMKIERALTKTLHQLVEPVELFADSGHRLGGITALTFECRGEALKTFADH